jgi:pimeloyl-ACP methyl ester carboxylesterase
MPTYSLVHGAWHGGWAWNRVRVELEAHGNVVHAPDLPCDDPNAGIEDYAAVVPPADVLVGHSLGGLTISLFPTKRVYVCALVPNLSWSDAFVAGFGSSRVRDELGRSSYPDAAAAVRDLQYPAADAGLAARLRPQAPVESDALVAARSLYVVCTGDRAVDPAWQRHAAAAVGAEVVELDAGHSPMLTHPRELADILERYAAS